MLLFMIWTTWSEDIADLKKVMGSERSCVCVCGVGNRNEWVWLMVVILLICFWYCYIVEQFSQTLCCECVCIFICGSLFDLILKGGLSLLYLTKNWFGCSDYLCGMGLSQCCIASNCCIRGEHNMSLLSNTLDHKDYNNCDKISTCFVVRFPNMALKSFPAKWLLSHNHYAFNCIVRLE